MSTPRETNTPRMMAWISPTMSTTVSTVEVSQRSGQGLVEGAVCEFDNRWCHRVRTVRLRVVT